MMELNEKLLKFVGFTLQELTYDRGITGIGWCYPNGERVVRSRGDEEVNFTSSLDACFRWLVPKLGGARISIGHTAGNPNTLVRVWTSPVYHWYEAEDLSPALALCKAIEQLMDKENDGSKH